MAPVQKDMPMVSNTSAPAKMISDILVENNFKVKLIEYWDESGKFQSIYQNDDGLGYIQRCLINDWRNANSQPNYTSLIIDAVKV